MDPSRSPRPACCSRRSDGGRRRARRPQALLLGIGFWRCSGSRPPEATAGGRRAVAARTCWRRRPAPRTALSAPHDAGVAARRLALAIGATWAGLALGLCDSLAAPSTASVDDPHVAVYFVSTTLTGAPPQVASRRSRARTGETSRDGPAYIVERSDQPGVREHARPARRTTPGTSRRGPSSPLPVDGTPTRSRAQKRSGRGIAGSSASFQAAV